MAAFTWTGSGNYPTGSQPWSGQPLALAPAQTYFTPGLKPAAEEFNYELGIIASNIATLETNCGPYRLAASYSVQVGLGPGFDGSPVIRSNVASYTAYTTLDYTTGGTPPVLVTGNQWTGGGATPTFAATDIIDITWIGSVAVYQGAGNGFTGNNVEIVLTGGVGTTSVLAIGDGSLLVPSFFQGSGAGEAPCIPITLRETVPVSALTGTAPGYLSLGLAAILQQGGPVSQRVSFYGSCWVNVKQYTLNPAL